MSHFWDTHHKVVVGFLNEEHPDRLGNTLLVAFCPESLDKYPEVAAILAPRSGLSERSTEQCPQAGLKELSAKNASGEALSMEAS